MTYLLPARAANAPLFSPHKCTSCRLDDSAEKAEFRRQYDVLARRRTAKQRGINISRLARAHKHPIQAGFIQRRAIPLPAPAIAITPPAVAATPITEQLSLFDPAQARPVPPKPAPVARPHRAAWIACQAPARNTARRDIDAKARRPETTITREERLAQLTRLAELRRQAGMADLKDNDRPEGQPELFDRGPAQLVLHAQRVSHDRVTYKPAEDRAQARFDQTVERKAHRIWKTRS